MITSQNHPRNWKEIARELSHEQNPSRCLELSLELTRAMNGEERKGGATWFAKDTDRLSNTEQPRRT